METKSLWVETAEKVKFPPLAGHIDADVAVVGGGITGLTAGILLQRAGKHVVILDNAQIAMGESGFTTAHLTRILDSRYYELIRDFGEEKAKLTAESKRAALDQIESLTRDYNIQCDFKRVDAFLYSEHHDDTEEFDQEINALSRVGISAERQSTAPLPFMTTKAIRIPNQAQFHPRKYMLKLAEEFVKLGGTIHEHTRVVDVHDGEPCHVDTENGKVTAAQVIVSANVPVVNWVFLHTKIAAYRTYAFCAPLHKALPTALFWDNLDPYHYIRTYDSKEGNYVIVGGEDHKTGTQTDTEACFKKLEHYARERLEIGNITYKWSGQIIEPVDGLPYIGLNSLCQHVYVSTGYSGNGMTFGTLGAMILTDLIMGRKNQWSPLYEATRLHPTASLSNFVSENIDVPMHLIGDRLAKDETESLNHIKRNEGKLITIDGHKIAACRDSNDVLHTRSAVCPHMGCYVKWNNAESSWDCPCHGSRFDPEGKVCNGPAVQDLKAFDASVAQRKAAQV